MDVTAPVINELNRLMYEWWPLGLILFLCCTIAAYAIAPPYVGFARFRNASGWKRAVAYLAVWAFWIGLGWWTGGGPNVVFGLFSVMLAIVSGLVGLWAAARVVGFIFGSPPYAN
jgi:hypothetical protein